MKYKPHEYQQIAYAHLMDNERAGLLLDMGLGKTSVTLTALKTLLHSYEIRKPLIVAPKLVTQITWTDEAKKWDHLKRLKISRIVGTPEERIAALNKKADIYIVSRDNIKWLVDYYGRKWPYDMLVLDEWSSFKNRASQRFKALRKVLGKTDRFVGLTGTPLPNGYLDLWPQMYLLDKGERLGKTLGGYKDEFFKPGRRNGHIVYEYKLKRGAAWEIQNLISDVCLSMRGADWLKLPEKQDVIRYFDLPEMEVYKKFEKDEVLKIRGKGWTFEQYDNFTMDGFEACDYIAPANSAGMYNKLLQFSNGAVYDSEGAYHIVSNAKLDLLCELIEEAAGKPVMVFYQFKSDVDRIKQRIKGVRGLKTEKDTRDWNAGKIPVLLIHPASAAHGLNLQDGGNYIIWYGAPWSSELYKQAIARIFRQGLKHKLINLHLVAKNTVDEIVIERVGEKITVQDDFMLALS